MENGFINDKVYVYDNAPVTKGVVVRYIKTKYILNAIEYLGK